MIQTVIFDIDNTLYDYDAAHAVAFRALTEYAQRELGVEPEAFPDLHKAANEVLKAHAGTNCAAIHSRLIRYQLLLEMLHKPLTHALPMERLYWNTLVDVAVPSPGARDCLAALKHSGVRLGIGTDMTADWQYVKLDRLGLLPWFDFIVTSEEASDEKPGERFFALCQNKAGCPAEDCAFVGDNLKKDVAGALNAGMRAVWYHPGEDAARPPAGALRVERLDQIPGLLLTSQNEL